MTDKPASAAHVQGDVGLNGSLSDYSSAICYGVFTLAHVRPSMDRVRGRAMPWYRTVEILPAGRAAGFAEQSQAGQHRRGVEQVRISRIIGLLEKQRPTTFARGLFQESRA